MPVDVPAFLEDLREGIRERKFYLERHPRPEDLTPLRLRANAGRRLKASLNQTMDELAESIGDDRLSLEFLYRDLDDALDDHPFAPGLRQPEEVRSEIQEVRRKIQCLTFELIITRGLYDQVDELERKWSQELDDLAHTGLVELFGTA